jgi:hypothetical protein
MVMSRKIMLRILVIVQLFDKNKKIPRNWAMEGEIEWQ